MFLTSSPCPCAAAAPAGIDFTSMGVQDMMRLYYCEARRRRRCQLPVCSCRPLFPPHPPTCPPLLPCRRSPPVPAPGDVQVARLRQRCGRSAAAAHPHLRLLPGAAQAACPIRLRASCCTCRLLPSRPQTASTPRATHPFSRGESSASRWMATFLCGTNPSRCSLLLHVQAMSCCMMCAPAGHACLIAGPPLRRSTQSSPAASCPPQRSAAPLPPPHRPAAGWR